MYLEKYLIENPKKHLIFDFDGTLFTLQLPWEIFRIQAKKSLAKIDPVLVKNYQGNLAVPLINLAINKHGKNAKKIIYPLRERFENEYLQTVRINQKLISFIQSSPKKFNYYIWSTNMQKTIVRFLNEHQLQSVFKKIISMDRVDLNKPCPDGFYKIFDPQKQEKSDFLMIGDADNDEVAAKNAGIDFFRIILTK